DLAMRGNFRKRRQHKGTFKQTWVRQRQAALLGLKGIVRDDVDIKCPRPPAQFLGTIAPKHHFDAQCAVEQRPRREPGFDGEREIDKGRLVGHAPRRGKVVRRPRHELHLAAVAERIDGAIKCCSHVAYITAESKQHFRHGSSAMAHADERSAQAGEAGVAHALAPIAAMMRNACTVAATSCVRMSAAPRWTASICAAIDPPSRWSGGAGVTASMKRLREAPTRSGKPKVLRRSSCAIAVMLCSAVLPKPMPGSSTMSSRR